MICYLYDALSLARDVDYEPLWYYRYLCFGLILYILASYNEMLNILKYCV